MKKQLTTPSSLRNESLKDKAIAEIREYSDQEIMWVNDGFPSNHLLCVRGKVVDFVETSKYTLAYLKETKLCNEKSLKPLNAIPWGETIRVTNHDNVLAYLNPFGDADKGIPNSEDREAAKLICTAVNNYQRLLDSNKEAIEIIEELVNHLEWREDFIVEDAEENENGYSKAIEFLKKQKN